MWMIFSLLEQRKTSLGVLRLWGGNLKFLEEKFILEFMVITRWSSFVSQTQAQFHKARYDPQNSRALHPESFDTLWPGEQKIKTDPRRFSGETWWWWTPGRCWEETVQIGTWYFALHVPRSSRYSTQCAKFVTEYDKPNKRCWTCSKTPVAISWW